MDIFTIAAVSVIISALSLFLKKENKELSFCITVTGIIIILSLVIKYTFPIYEQIKDLSDLADISNEILSVMLKASGISFIAGFASQICKDIGEGSFSMHIETTAKVLILVLCLPLIKAVLTELLKFTEV